MARPPVKPEPFRVEWLTVHPERPPIASDPRWWWRGSFYVERETKHVPIGRATREEAGRLAAEVVAKGKPAGAPAAEAMPAVRTVRDLVEAWVAHQLARSEAHDIAPRSYLAYKASATRLVSSKRTPTLGDVPTADLSEAEVEAYMLARARDRADGSRGDAHKTINDDVSVLLMAWKWGRVRGRRYCPAVDLDIHWLKPRPVRTRVTPTRDHLEALIPHLRPRYALLVSLMSAAGARIGEIAALEWADVDLEAGTMWLGRHEGATKTGARETPIEPEIVDLLRDWYARPPERPPRGAAPSEAIRGRWVLGVQPVTAVSLFVSRYLPPACAAAGLERFTSHGIRRWATDEMGRSDVEPATGASLQGHSAAEAARRYRVPTLADKRVAVRRARLGVVRRS